MSGIYAPLTRDGSSVSVLTESARASNEDVNMQHDREREAVINHKTAMPSAESNA